MRSSRQQFPPGSIGRSLGTIGESLPTIGQMLPMAGELVEGLATGSEVRISSSSSALGDHLVEPVGRDSTQLIPERSLYPEKRR